jgi:magnesium chelatase family protein
VDIQVALNPVTAAQLAAESSAAEASATVAARVAAARAAAGARWAGTGWRTNAEVPGPHLRRAPYRLPPGVLTALHRSVDSGALSARGFDRVLRLAWTVADLDGRDRPGSGDVDEAQALRMGRIG